MTQGTRRVPRSDTGAERTRDYGYRAAMKLAMAIALGGWMKETWKGLKKEEDVKRSQEGVRMMTAIKGE